MGSGGMSYRDRREARAARALAREGRMPFVMGLDGDAKAYNKAFERIDRNFVMPSKEWLREKGIFVSPQWHIANDQDDVPKEKVGRALVRWIRRGETVDTMKYTTVTAPLLASASALRGQVKHDLYHRVLSAGGKLDRRKFIRFKQ